MIYNGFISWLAPIIAITTPHFPDINLIYDIKIGLIIYCLAFVITSSVTDGMTIANMTYIMDIAPEKKRPTYIGLLNTIISPFTLIPILGGYIINISSYYVIFIISIVTILLYLYYTSKIDVNNKKG